MGSPAGASTNFPGASASVFTPTGQGAADTTLQNLIASYPTASTAPASQYYPDAQAAYSTYVTNYPSIDKAIASADTAFAFEKDTAFPQQTGSSADLAASGKAALPYGTTALGYGFDPEYTTLVSQAENNPFYGPALAGAQQAADIGTTGAGSLATGAQQTLDTAFDPQNKLYNQGRTNALDYSNVTNAMAGLGGTPYGSSVSANTLNNYDLNWQDRQLGRQEKALGAADTALTDASQLAYTASGYPSKTYTGHIKDITTALAARSAGATAGATGYADIAGAAGKADTEAATLDTNALKDYSYYGALPEKTSVGIGKDLIAGEDAVIDIGNNQYYLPSQEIKALESYLKLGQDSSTISGDLGKAGLSELGSATAGLGSAASTANNLTGGGITKGVGSLFGSGAGTGGASTLADFGAGGGTVEAGTAALDAGALTTDAVSAASAAAMWIVCTELVRQGRMPKRYWAAGSRRFAAYSAWGKRGYYVWAVPAVHHLRQHPDSLLSSVLATTFGWRAEHLAAKAGVRGARRLWRGAAVAGGLALLCGILGVFPERNWRAVYDTDT